MIIMIYIILKTKLQFLLRMLRNSFTNYHDNKLMIMVILFFIYRFFREGNVFLGNKITSIVYQLKVLTVNESNHH